MNYKTAIVIPLFNQGEFLDDAIKSVLNQRLEIQGKLTNIRPPISLTIVNDASTDNSLEIAQELQKKYMQDYSFLFQLISNKYNMGLAETRNIGIKKSSGDNIICLDADDILEPNYISELARELVLGYDVAYSDMHLFGTRKGIISTPEYTHLQLRYKNFINATAMFKRKCWKKVNGYDERFYNGFEDWDFWLRLAKNNFKFIRVGTTHLNYRRHAESMLSNSAKKDMAKIQLKNKFNDFQRIGK